ncbi:UPF0687 protein C20orf27 homolog, partial [Notechis scutatus]|uniref:Adipose-secreted signaling protein n=1 Tax=Notechis scutatus TaxID=8663 RepID=A0A6J1W3I9_9SAUR
MVLSPLSSHAAVTSKGLFNVCLSNGVRLAPLGLGPDFASPFAQVGFLKIMHKYEITFVLPFVQVLGTDICPAPLSNLHLKVTDIAPISEGYRVRCEYVAHKEGVLHEEMVLCSESNHSASIKVVVQARVMGKALPDLAP